MATAPTKATKPMRTNVISYESRSKWKIRKTTTRATNVPTWLKAAMRPSTWPLLSCVVRLMPSEYWVCSMVCIPKLLMRIHGITVTKLVAIPNIPNPRARRNMAPEVSRGIDTR